MREMEVSPSESVMLLVVLAFWVCTGRVPGTLYLVLHFECIKFHFEHIHRTYIRYCVKYAQYISYCTYRVPGYVSVEAKSCVTVSQRSV
jgi:hypothetical protein